MSAILNVQSDGLNSSEFSDENSIFSPDFSSENKFVRIVNKNSGSTVEGKFMLEDGFESLFPLFKGLSELGKPKFLDLKYCFDQKSISFSFAKDHASTVYTYFKSLIQLLKKESRFREVWKDIISNRDRFNAEQKLLQTELLN